MSLWCESQVQVQCIHLSFSLILVTFTAYFDILMIPVSLPCPPISLIKKVTVVQGYNPFCAFSPAEHYTASSSMLLQDSLFVHLSIEDVTCLAFVLPIC